MSEALRQIAMESPSGARLNVFYCEPRGTKTPKAIIQINHGMSEHAERYERFMQALAERGYGSIAHDHRGHGLTTAPDAQQGQFARAKGFDKVVDDIVAIDDWTSEHWPDAPLVCFGHSMGAIIALNFALRNRDRLQGLVLWNASFDNGLLLKIGRIVLKWERWRKGSDVPSLLAKKITFDDWNAKFKPNRTDFDWLSTDEDEVNKYAQDPLCGFPVSIGLWLELLDAIDWAGHDQNLLNLPTTLPIHIQGGDKDPATNNGSAMQALYDRLRINRQKDLTLNIIKGARHESLNETKRDEITADFIDWLDARFRLC